MGYIQLLKMARTKIKLAESKIETLNAYVSNMSDKITELEKDIAFLQSCVNSGETATKADRPSERAKALKEGKEMS
jgi:uncharacterized coiled-coil DUF342 family protein